MNANQTYTYGKLAMSSGFRLPIQVLKSAAGFYIGTANSQGPCSRESVEYWRTSEEANKAFSQSAWTQRQQS